MRGGRVSDGRIASLTGDNRSSSGPPRDGLYRVETPSLVAGFVVESGRVVRSAPILRRRLAYWLTRAERIA